MTTTIQVTLGRLATIGEESPGYAVEEAINWGSGTRPARNFRFKRTPTGLKKRSCGVNWVSYDVLCIDRDGTQWWLTLNGCADSTIKLAD